MTGPEFTSEEMAWIAENRETIRNLMAASPKRKTLVLDELADPLDRAARGLASSMRAKIAELESALKETESRLEFGRNLIKSQRQEGAPPRTDHVDYVQIEAPAQIERLLRRKLHLERKLLQLSDHREDAFLPLGTVVRFVGVLEHGAITGLGEDTTSYPVEGSVGVVTRISQKGQHALGVSMRRPFADGWGNAYVPEDDRLPTFKVDREMLAVVGYGRLPDGSEFRGYGFLPTYAARSRDDDPEMIIEADGHYWRFHDYGGDRSVEALQAFDSLEEMPWVGDPLIAETSIARSR